MLVAETPLRASKRELRAAKTALERMRVTQSLDEFVTEWQTFIERLEKVWVKVERECQPFRTKFEPWQGTFKATRKSDPLLRYLYQSRHGDQHTVQIVMGVIVPVMSLTLPPLGSAARKLDQEKGTLTITAGDNDIQYKVLQPQPRLFLVPITNQGNQYEPAKEHLGVPFDGTDPILAAENGLAFYQNFLQQAEAKFFPAPAASEVNGESAGGS